MKQNSRLSSLVVFALFIFCVLGCSKLGSQTTSTEPVAKNTNAAPDVARPPADIAGDYTVVGTNENGSPYRGSLKVIKHGDVYQFRWDAGRQYDGVGVPKGNVVAVAFAGGTNGEGCGVVSYQILANGSLDGNWGYWGKNEMGTEQATRNSGAGLAGDYNVIGKNPNGSSYKADLSITPKAGGYQFVWSNNTSGFGIKQGDTASVGIGGSRCGFVAYEIKPDGALDGVWGGYGSSNTGTEKATKR